jgi:hypothetical protein
MFGLFCGFDNRPLQTLWKSGGFSRLFYQRPWFGWLVFENRHPPTVFKVRLFLHTLMSKDL